MRSARVVLEYLSE